VEMARTVRENDDEVETEVVEESSLHTYRTENGYRIINVTIYDIFIE
jgi:hypothetical protein